MLSSHYYSKPVYKLLIGLAFMLAARLAFADLMLYPTRVVLEKNQRAAQVEIVNRGQKPETYRINLVNRRMTETGEIVEVKEAQAGENFADAMVRYSPRQVTLQPGTAQTVRISVRKPAGLADGEYRSHLQFDRVPDAEGQANLENIAKPESGQISIVLQALVGASIPVIVRQGDTASSVTLDSVQLAPAKEKNDLMLEFNINRQGNRSVYGDLVVNYQSPDGKSIEVAKVAGLAVYVPNALRKARVLLKFPEGVSPAGGVLQVNYLERPDAGGKLIAQAEFKL